MIPGPFTFTDDLSIEVNKTTTEYIAQNNLEEIIKEISWCFHAVQGVIPHTNESFWSGHFFPMIECWEELQVSINLCLFGFYKQSMCSLRSALELGLLSVYWNINDDGHITIKNWLKSEVDTPRLGDVWDKLKNHPNFSWFQGVSDLKSRLLSFGYLHNFVHTKGGKYSNRIGLLKSNCQTFEEKGFNSWLESYREVIKILTLLHLIKYPIGVVEFEWSNKFGIDKPMFGGLEVHQIQQIANLIGNEDFSRIKELAHKDHNVTEIMEWIENLPDLTEKELEDQIIHFDKDMIENMGLNDWLKMEEKSQPWSKKVQERVNSLVQWAKENGYENSKFERLTKKKESI